MTYRLYTHPVPDTSENFVRNALLSGALIWGWSGSWNRAAAVTAIALPTIYLVGRLRSTGSDNEGAYIKYRRGTEEKTYHIWNDLWLHPTDVLCVLGVRALWKAQSFERYLLYPAILGSLLHLTPRLLSLYPHEEYNSRHHDTPTLGLYRMQKIFCLA